MRNKKQQLFLGIIMLVLIAWMLKSTFTQSGIKNLKGGFKEMVKYRNENNTGPIQRIYIVTVKDTVGAQFTEYGNLMPHTKYGNTKVYFFMEGTKIPAQLQPGTENFDPQFNLSCIALYEKSAMSQAMFNKQPFH